MIKKQRNLKKINFIVRPKIGLVSYPTDKLHSAGYKLVAKCTFDDPKLNIFIQNKENLGFKVKVLDEDAEDRIVHVWLKSSIS